MEIKIIYKVTMSESMFELWASALELDFLELACVFGEEDEDETEVLSFNDIVTLSAVGNLKTLV